MSIGSQSSKSGPAGYVTNAHKDLLAGAGQWVPNLGPQPIQAPTADHAVARDLAYNTAFGPGVYNTDMAAAMAGNYANSTLFGAPVVPPPPVSSGGGGGGGGVSGFGGGDLFVAPPDQAQMMDAADIYRGDIRDVQGTNFLAGDIDAYMNPYTDHVMERAQADLERQRQIAMTQQQGAAAAAGAFGGSRHGVLEAETNRGFADVGATQAAQLRAAAFDDGAARMMADQRAAMEAEMVNQGMDWATASQNAEMLQQANMANQAAQNEREQFISSTHTGANVAQYQTDGQVAAAGAAAGASAASANAAAQANMYNAQLNYLTNQGQLGLQALGLYGDLGNQQFNLGMTGAGAIAGFGDLYRDYGQQVSDSYWQLPMIQQGLLNDTLHAGGPMTSQSSSGWSMGLPDSGWFS